MLEMTFVDAQLLRTDRCTYPDWLKVNRGFRSVGRQTARYSPELEPDIVLTQLHASCVDEILHTL
jgi:hypothetical protein